MKLQNMFKGMREINWSSEKIEEARRELEVMTRSSIEGYRLKKIESLKKISRVQI